MTIRGWVLKVGKFCFQFYVLKFHGILTRKFDLGTLFKSELFAGELG